MTRQLTVALLGFALTAACHPVAAPVSSVGPQGGTVVSEDGRLRVAVPPGALADEVTITIGRTGDCYEVGPAGTEFAVPAQLTLDAAIDRHASVLGLDPVFGHRLCAHHS
jgi:hypothetical protein